MGAVTCVFCVLLHAVLLASLSRLVCLVESVTCSVATVNVHVHIVVYSFDHRLCMYVLLVSLVFYCHIFVCLIALCCVVRLFVGIFTLCVTL